MVKCTLSHNFFLCAHSNTLQPTSLLPFLASIPLHATLTTMTKVQRNECTFYNCVQGLLDKKEAIRTQGRRIEQGLPVKDEDRPVPLTKREDRSMAFICVCRKPFLTRDSLSKHYKRVCAHSNIPINVPGLQLIDSAQVLPHGSEVRMQIMAFQEQQRTLITTTAGQGQGQAASASASDTGTFSPVSTSRKKTRSGAPHFGTFRPLSCMSPTENK
ncbi:hypothetical protein BC939DRAFT_445521 [Gamsiella multidivaricata]|uniref:uncharacterized protein n=1 Tax=Gamsiella multidivaricata TaxID=101098 RepID=UPI00221ECEBD|nr:uncharacterized protein BC939DRAFT_445521 [Gamsiella multidivaricata]KAI7827531.1 hypothetical protein BC939DRAFT_445521 [Gamsiella multidivaricata]